MRHSCSLKSQSVNHSVMSDSLWPHGLYSLPGSPVHGVLQARILEWVVIPFSKGFSQPRDQTHIPYIVCRFFTIGATKEVHNSLKQWLKHWFKSIGGTSLVVKWLRNRLPRKGTWVCFLVRKTPAAISLCTTTTEACTPRACALQQQKPPEWEARHCDQERPRSPHPGKAWAQRLRRSTAENK